MRIHFKRNTTGTPASKLADVEIHFEEGLLAGLTLVGCSVWKAKKGDAPTVMVPSRSYTTAAGLRYFEMLRPSVDGPERVKAFKEYIRAEYLKCAEATK